MLLLSQFFLPTSKSKQEAKSFSIYETKWEFHPDGHRATLRIYKFPSPQTELTQYTAILLQSSDIQLSSLTGYFHFQHRPQKQPTSATPIMPYDCTSWKWVGMDLASSVRTGSNDWNPSMRHQCCLWTRGWTLGLFFLDIL